MRFTSLNDIDHFEDLKKEPAAEGTALEDADENPTKTEKTFSQKYPLSAGAEIQ